MNDYIKDLEEQNDQLKDRLAKLEASSEIIQCMKNINVTSYDINIKNKETKYMYIGNKQYALRDDFEFTDCTISLNVTCENIKSVEKLLKTLSSLTLK